MRFFKTIFGKTEQNGPFRQGDIFYSMLEGRYHLYKLLRHDREYGIYHVLCYAPLDKLPEKNGIDRLEVFAWHAPIADNGFGNPQLFAHTSVTQQDLYGYIEYLRRTNYPEYLIETGQDPKAVSEKVNALYREAYELTDQKRHLEAIEKYSEAVEIMPIFYEAIDNRAFCKMDLGRWQDAIADFELSLEVNPDSVLAISSIGECYLRLGRLQTAKMQFEKSLQLSPDDEVTKKLLAKTLALMEQHDKKN